ncbi:MAG TPA: hypothetical protein VNT75_18785 [Symbiobacteriaceae bacterium]|nr:hypothetical protein [Symbiobacteriaceae bacterium]
MPWLRVVWKLWKLRLMRSHDGDLFLQWNGGHSHKLPSVKLPRRRRKHGHRAG